MSAPPSADSAFRDYVRQLLLLIVLGMGLVAGFNGLVDPYDVIGTPRWPGFNQYKHGTRENSRIAKVYMVERVQPRTLIIGSSRAEMALDPAHPSLLQPAFNLSVEGASMYEQWRLVQHALAVAPVQELIVSLDFFAFQGDKVTGKGFAEDRLAVQADGSPTGRRRSDLVEALFSYAALNLSFKTLAGNFRKPGYVINGAGFREVWDHNRDILKRGGYRVAFNSNERINAAGTYGTPEHPLGLAGPESPLPAMAYFRNMVRDARQHNVRVRFVMYPKHARQQELIRALGLWPVYQRWKAELADTARREGLPGKIELWDFATVSAVNAEEVPPAGDDRTAMRYYREGSHCTKALGDLMLQRLAGGTENLPSHFGIDLLTADVPAELQRQTAALAAWRAGHPSDAQEIAGTLRDLGLRAY